MPHSKDTKRLLSPTENRAQNGREIEQCTLNRTITTLIQSHIRFACRAGNKNSFSSRRMGVVMFMGKGAKSVEVRD